MSSFLLILLILNSTHFSLMANGKWVNVTFPYFQTKFPKNLNFSFTSSYDIFQVDQSQTHTNPPPPLR